MPSLAPSTASIKTAACVGFTVPTFVRAATKILVNTSHRSCERNGDHLGLFIKTGGTQNERMMSQTINRTF